MSFQPQRMHDVKWALSTKKQADYTTLVADADLNKQISIIGADAAEISRTAYSNDKQYGKGHEFPTAFRELTRELRLSRTLDLSSLMAGWVAAFGMGKVVTTQPNLANNPTAYRHTCTFLDTSVGKQVPVTTVYEQIVGQPALQRRLESLAVADFSISGRAREVAQVQMNLVGSGKTTNGSMSTSSLTPVSILDMGGMIFKLGPQGSPIDLTERLIDFSVHVTQGLDVQNAYVPGGGLYASRMWVGARRATFEAQLFVDAGSSDILDYFLNANLLEASFKFVGDKILNTQPETHDCTIAFPAVRISAAPISTQGDMVIYRISAGEENVYKDAGGTPNEPIQITVTNNIPSYLTT